ncbi:MAG: hypothetical protein QW610_02195 [Pyrobaculum sp.]
MSSLLGIAKDGENYYIINVTENYKTKLINWFGDLEQRIIHSLKSGTSIALIGPHGVGKSVLARYVAAKLVGEYYAVIDLGVDVATFDSLLEILHEVPDAIGFFDPLGITFYDSPLLPRTDPAVIWMSKCKSIIDRSLYLTTRDVATLIVMPNTLYRYSRCREYIERYMKILDLGEYLQRQPLREILESIFSSHASSLGCKKIDTNRYVDYILSRHSDLSGVFVLAAYGGRVVARERCTTNDETSIYKKVLDEVANLYGQLYKDLFFPTCRDAKSISIPLLLSLKGQYLPYGITQPLSNIDKVSRRLLMLNKLTSLKDVTSLVVEEILEELRELYEADTASVAAQQWSVDRKESIVAESLKLTLEHEQCIEKLQDVVQKIRIVYKGLLAIKQDIAYDFAKAIAYIATGRLDICKEEVGKYLCNNGEVPQIVVEALSAGRRITLEISTVFHRHDDSDELIRAALTDARRAPLRCVENIIDILYRDVALQGKPIDIFYKFFHDYVEVALNRHTPTLLRKLALSHFYSKSLPQEAYEVLKTVITLAYVEEDYKTVEAAAAALTKLSHKDALKYIPQCECPYLKATVAYRIAKTLVELGEYQEALKTLEIAIDEIKKGDKRYEFTQSFIQEVENLYRQAALEILL